MKLTGVTVGSLCTWVSLVCLLACCSGPMMIHVSDEYHGQIELVDARYDAAIPDTMARVIIDCFLEIDKSQRWYSFVTLRPAFEGKEKKIRTSTIRSDTLYVPATMYSIVVKYKEDACFQVASRPVPLYHQHEYKLRCIVHVPYIY